MSASMVSHGALLGALLSGYWIIDISLQEYQTSSL